MNPLVYYSLLDWRDHFSHTLLALTISLQYGDTALIIAARDGHTDIVRELLSSGANVDQFDNVSDKNTYMYLYTWKGFVMHKLQCMYIYSIKYGVLVTKFRLLF